MNKKQRLFECALGNHDWEEGEFFDKCRNCQKIQQSDIQYRMAVLKKDLEKLRRKIIKEKKPLTNNEEKTLFTDAAIKALKKGLNAERKKENDGS